MTAEQKSGMFVSITHEHKCKRIATCPSMGEGRDWWAGKLTEPVLEHPQETHCLHLKTQHKEVVFLCTKGDFSNLAVLAIAVYGKIASSWMESQVEYSKTIER